MFVQHSDCNTNTPFCWAILIFLVVCFFFFFPLLLCSQNKYSVRSWKAKRSGWTTKVTMLLWLLESCYFPPPFLPVLIVLVSWLGYFQPDALFDLYSNSFWDNKRKKTIYSKSRCWAWPNDVKFCRYSSCDLFVKAEVESRK